MAHSPEDLKGFIAMLSRRERQPVALAQFQQDGKDKVIYAIYKSEETKVPHDAITYLLQSLMGYDRIVPSDLKNIIVYTDAAPSDMAKGMLAMLSGGTGSIEVADANAQVDYVALGEVFQTENRTGLFFKARQFETKQDLSRFQCPDIESPEVDLTANDATPHSGTHTVHRIYMMCAYAMLKKHDAIKPDGKYVAALLVGSKGKILGWGINTNSLNETFHAEVNLIQSYYSAKKKKKIAYTGLPRNARIYTTLQCCQMCAGMIYSTAAEAGTIHVYYGMLDPSQNSKPRALVAPTYTLESRLNTSGGATTKPIKLPGATGDLPALLEQQYQNRTFGSMDAASFGKHMPVDAVLAELARKYKRNMTTSPIYKDDGSLKQFNPNVQRAIHHVCLFLTSMSINPGY